MEYFPHYAHPQAQAQVIYQHPAFAHSSMAQEYPSYVDQHNRMYNVPRRAASMTSLNQLANANQNGEKPDTKPRLSKQEVEILERQFQDQFKPTSNTKRQLAERFNVDVARINNWFQNRRAKAKQEKKQEEYGLSQASRNRTFSEPSSPDQFGHDEYSSENQFQSPDSHASAYSMPHASLPTPAAPCNVRYENPAAASRESLQRTLLEAGCPQVQHGEIPSDDFQDEVTEDHFDPTLAFDSSNGLPMGDHAPFPMPEERVGNNAFGYLQEPMFEPIFSMEQLSQQPMAVQEAGSDGFGCYITSPPEHHGSIDGTMTTFPSQLLPAGHDVSELTPRPFTNQAFSPATVEGSQSPPGPADFRLMSPPPAVPIAHRRRKHLPAAIGTSAITDKSSSGPKTCNIPRPLNSPSIKMRRVSSVNGSLSVKAGRIQKSSAYLPQRSPLLRHFSEGGVSFLEQNARNVQHMPMPLLSATSATWKQFAPPTPNSPRERLLSQQYEKLQQEGNTPQQMYSEDHKAASSSPSESEQSYAFNRQGSDCFTLNALNTNMASPPETPSHQAGHYQWNNYEVPDDALLTPGIYGNFALEGLHHPQPQYVSPLTSSQPPTPAFGQFTGYPYIHNSPVIEIPDSAEVDYHNQYFSEGPSSISSYPTVSSNHSSPEVPKNDKVYQFSNATPKDYEQIV